MKMKIGFGLLILMMVGFLGSRWDSEEVDQKAIENSMESSSFGKTQAKKDLRAPSSALETRSFNKNVMDAMMSGDWKTVLEYLKAGGNPNLQDENGKSLLEWAALSDNLELMKALIEAGADPNLQDHAGGTSLMVAASESHLNAMKLLLESGANPEVKNDIGQTALLVAVENSGRESLDLLVERGARLDVTFGEEDFNAYLLASVNGDGRMMDRLIELHPGFVHSRDRTGRTAAHWTCADGDIQAAASILRHGGRLDAKDNYGRRAFEYGADKGKGACLAFIEEAGLKDYF